MRDILSKLNAILEETDARDIENTVISNENLDSKEFENTKEDHPIYQIGDEFGISFSEDFEISTTITDILEDGIVVELDDHALEILTAEGLSFTEVNLEEKIKGVDGKACWRGYRYAGTEKGKDRCVKVRKVKEDADQIQRMYDEWLRSEEAPRDDESGDYDAVFTKALRFVADKIQNRSDSEYFAHKLTNIYHGEDMEEAVSWPYAGKAVGHKEGPAGQLKGRMKRPAKAGDLVGGSESIEYDVDEAKYQGREVPLGKPMKGDVKKSKVYVRGPKGNVVKVNFGDKKMRIKKSNPNRRKSFRARHNCSNPGPRWKARYWSCRAW